MSGNFNNNDMKQNSSNDNFYNRISNNENLIIDMKQNSSNDNFNNRISNNENLIIDNFNNNDYFNNIIDMKENNNFNITPKISFHTSVLDEGYEDIIENKINKIDYKKDEDYKKIIGLLTKNKIKFTNDEFKLCQNILIKLMIYKQYILQEELDNTPFKIFKIHNNIVIIKVSQIPGFKKNNFVTINYGFNQAVEGYICNIIGLFAYVILKDEPDPISNFIMYYDNQG